LLRIIAKHYEKIIELQQIKNLSETTREGISLLGLSAAAEALGFRTLGIKVSFETLQNESPLPCIVHWNNQHFVVVYKIKNNTIYISDSSHGLIPILKKILLNFGLARMPMKKQKKAMLFYLEPTTEFHKRSGIQLIQN
jgi:ATP-binding cassette subfamily B protein